MTQVRCISQEPFSCLFMPAQLFKVTLQYYHVLDPWVQKSTITNTTHTSHFILCQLLWCQVTRIRMCVFIHLRNGECVEPLGHCVKLGCELGLRAQCSHYVNCFLLVFSVQCHVLNGIMRWVGVEDLAPPGEPSRVASITSNVKFCWVIGHE